jgi:hypothetical protein
MSGIFISYRRNDSAPWAGRVYDSLVREWGDDLVFMDVDAIAPGEDFREVIADTVARSDVILVVIGPEWMSTADSSGGRRLDDEGDIHRTEVVAALTSRARVIPVLVGGASMPKVAELPEPLKDLAYRNAVVLEDRRFGSDVRALQKALARFAEEAAAAPAVEVLADPVLERGPDAEATESAIEPVPLTLEPLAPAAEPTPLREPVGQPKLEEVVEQQQPKPEAEAGPTPEGRPVPVAESVPRLAPTSQEARAWVVIAGLAAIAAAFYVIVVNLSVVDYFEATITRTKNFGSGDIPVLLSAVAMAAAGASALNSRLQPFAIGAGFSISLPLALRLLQNRSIGLYTCGYDCVLDAPAGRAWTFAGPILLIVAGLFGIALWRSGALAAGRWAPANLGRLVIAVFLLWVVSTTINPYSIDDVPYGSAVFTHGPGATAWGIIGALVVIALVVVAFRFLRREPGLGALIGTGLLPAVSIVTELAYLSDDYQVPTSSGRVWLMLLPAAAAVVLVTLCVVRTVHTDPAT